MEYKKLSENAKEPIRETNGAAGYDLYSATTNVVPSRGRCLINTDIALHIPDGYYGKIAPRSGLALKYGLDVGGGIIDSDFRGGIGVILFNHTDCPYYVKKHDKIAQIIIMPIITPKLKEVNDLSITERGTNGFGSTG